MKILIVTLLLFTLFSCNSQIKEKTLSKIEVLSDVDYNLILDNKIVDGIPIETIQTGNLKVTSGQIMAFDPLVYPDTKPFLRQVKPGNYPVTIYVAKTSDSGDRHALAKLEFTKERAEKWVLAITKEDSILNLKEGEYFGFPVDAGLGAFCDYEGGKAYDKFGSDFMKSHPEGNIYDDFFASQFKKNAKDKNDPKDYGDWLNFKIPHSDYNVIMFQSGYGDGLYPSYWGIDKNGEIVSLVIDFLVFQQ